MRFISGADLLNYWIDQPYCALLTSQIFREKPCTKKGWSIKTVDIKDPQIGLCPIK